MPDEGWNTFKTLELVSNHNIPELGTVGAVNDSGAAANVVTAPSTLPIKSPMNTGEVIVSLAVMSPNAVIFLAVILPVSSIISVGGIPTVYPPTELNLLTAIIPFILFSMYA